MAWRQTGDKPLSEPMMTQFNDAYMRHSASGYGLPPLRSRFITWIDAALFPIRLIETASVDMILTIKNN